MALGFGEVYFIFSLAVEKRGGGPRETGSRAWDRGNLMGRINKGGNFLGIINMAN